MALAKKLLLSTLFLHFKNDYVIEFLCVCGKLFIQCAVYIYIYIYIYVAMYISLYHTFSVGNTFHFILSCDRVQGKAVIGS